MKLGQIRGINSIRTVGVILVVIYHYIPRLLPAGFLGVDVFFAISGFLVTALFVREYDAHEKIDLLAFFVRRVRRLLPAAAFMVICTLTMAQVVSPDLRVGVRAQVAAVFGWVQNYYEIATGGSYEGRLLPSFFVHTWTLGVEMQYYIVWGILVAVVYAVVKLRGGTAWGARQALILGCAALSVIAYAHMQILYIGSPEDPSVAYYATTARICSLLVGSALGAATGMKTPVFQPAAPVCVLGIGVSLVVLVYLARILSFTAEATYRWGLLAAALLTALILWLILSLQRFEWFREIHLIAMVGRRSYSIYLFHLPVFIILSQLAETGRGPFPNHTPHGVVIALSVVCTLLLAEVSYRFFESRPIAAPERRAVSRGPKRGAPLLSVLCAAMVLVSFFSISGAPAKTLIEADYEHQQELLNIGKMAQYDDYLAALALNPVLLHAQSAALPESPSARAARLEAEAAGLLDPAQAAHTESPDGAVVPILPPGGADVTIIGDSVTLGAAETLQATLGSVLVDAKESRNMGVGADIIHQYADSGQLGEYVVLALFTNYQNFTVDATYVAIDALPAGHKLILVTPYGKDYMEAGATFVRDVSQQFDFIAVADWNLAIRDHRDELAPDGMHMNTPNSRQIYANCIAQAIEVAKDKPAKGAG
ncbi:MAG: acyltransferase [Clostridiales Family XIII bacterium]|jgi:peptidoglycan/LPS O-acetylase OafA/YrhL|nr:acyltransferase [Clostridiales Family XIII bacterium]